MKTNLITMGLLAMLATACAPQGFDPSSSSSQAAPASEQSVAARLLADQNQFQTALANAGITVNGANLPSTQGGSTGGLSGLSGFGSSLPSQLGNLPATFPGISGTVPFSSIATCALSSSVTTDLTSLFQTLQPSLQQIITDAENQNTSGLSSDLQQYQTALVSDMQAIETDMQACLTSASAPTGTTKN